MKCMIRRGRLIKKESPLKKNAQTRLCLRESEGNRTDSIYLPPTYGKKKAKKSAYGKHWDQASDGR